MQEIKISIIDIIKLHRELSENIKTYETLTDEYMPIEVSNELRYAFRAIIDYIDDDKKNDSYDLVRTHYALRCASFDLIDGLILTVYEYINECITIYPIETMEVVDGAMDMYEYIHSLNEKISQSRGGSQDNKLLIYNKLHKNAFKTLSSHYKTLKISYPIIRKMFIEKKSKEKKNYFMGIGGIMVGAIIGLLGIIVPIMISQ